jgi:hypothetical protein
MYQVEIRTIDPISKGMLSRELKWFDTYAEATSFVEGYNTTCPPDKEAIWVPFH